MKDEEINIAIAEALGAYRADNDWHHPNGARVTLLDPLPNFCNDLNAMHEAESYLLSGPLLMINHEERGQLKRAYQERLERVATLHGGCAICAEAEWRAEAFLRTLGKWIE